MPLLKNIKEVYDKFVLIDKRIEDLENDFKTLGSQVEKITVRETDLEKAFTGFDVKFETFQGGIGDKMELACRRVMAETPKNPSKQLKGQ